MYKEIGNFNVSQYLSLFLVGLWKFVGKNYYSLTLFMQLCIYQNKLEITISETLKWVFKNIYHIQ
jgi:hypothetical protein